MESLKFSKNIIQKILYICNIFKGDSIKNESSAREALLSAAIFFLFVFILCFGYNKKNEFVLSQLFISTFYPNYSDTQFYKMFNYFSILLFAFLANVLYSLASTIIFFVYLSIDRGISYSKNISLIIKIFCQSSKCFSICGLVIFSMLPFIFIKIHSPITPKNLFLLIQKELYLIFTLITLTLIFCLIRPISKLKDGNHEKNSSRSFNVFDIIDSNFPTSLLLIQVILSIFFLFSIDPLLKILIRVTPSLINQTGLLNVEYNYIVSSPETPPAIKSAYKQVGSSKFISCFEMPDSSTQNACINQLFLSSRNFYTIAKFGEKDYCRLQI
jgi:hypothetical protein